MNICIACILTACVLYGSVAEARNIYVAAPKVLRLGIQEKIGIAVDGIADQHLEVFVQDYPDKKKNLSHAAVTVSQENPEIATLHIEPEDIKDTVLADSNRISYVSLVVYTDGFHKEAIIPLSFKSGYVFLQTDKPIYTPKQKVQFRIIALDDELRPITNDVRFQIRNPKNVIVRETTEGGKKLRPDQLFIIPRQFTFSPTTLLGKWSATVLSGYKFQQSTTIEFEVNEYVLPTFWVKIIGPDVILPSDKIITFSIAAKYVYGKPVTGKASFRLGIQGQTPEVTFFAHVRSKKLDNGNLTVDVNTDELKWHPNVGWFPRIEGFHFIIEANVTDTATGQKESAKDRTGIFEISPFIISFKRCLKDFKPGLRSIIEANVNYANGRPASGIKTVLTGNANGNLNLMIYANESTSDAHGRIQFVIHPEVHHNTVSFEVKTNDTKYGVHQTVGRFGQQQYRSKSNAYIAIARRSRENVKPGTQFSEVVHISGELITDIYFLVTAKGKIILVKKLPSGHFANHRVEFEVTHEMGPSFRVLVFGHFEDELIADSCQVDVVNECNSMSNIIIEPGFETRKAGKISIQGYNDTAIGLWAIDSVVYALSDQGLLTQSKLFKTLENLDAGCGPGGGLNTDEVLRSVGMLLLTNHYSSSSTEELSCQKHIRRKKHLASAKRSYDYDNQNDVREIIQNTVEEKVKLQAAETEKYEAALSQMQEGSLRKRSLDLTFPGRLVFYFLFDVSGSVKNMDFLSSITFAKELIKKIGVTKHDVRVGALTFGSKTNIEFLPTQYETTEEVLDALDAIEFGGGRTAISNALQVVKDEMIPLTKAHFGFSIGIKSVVFVMTDGKTSTRGNPKEKAYALKEAEVEIYCIGITRNPKKDALREISSKPYNEYVFILKDYKTLDSLVQEIANGTIGAYEVQEGDLRKISLDSTFPGRWVFYFLFDTSANVKKKNFLLSKKFAKEIIKKIGVTRHGARVGALTFSSKVNIEFPPPEYETTEEVLRALDGIKFGSGGGGTETINALQMVINEMMPLTREHLAYSSNFKSVIFIMTDGKANFGGNPRQEADKLKDEVEIYCIGITDDLKKDALYEIASKPYNEHVFALRENKTHYWLEQEIENGTTGSNSTKERIRPDEDFFDDLVLTEAELEDYEKDVHVRQFFRQTWIFTDLAIRSNGKVEHYVSLPDSITTWEVQAVAISPYGGICIAPQKEIKSMKKLFIQLDLPYEVVRNEQIEIKATVFNYRDEKITITVYMYGVKDLCSGFQEGQKSERKSLIIEPHSAQSVYFPVIPLKQGIYDIKVAAISEDGSDVIVRQLNVVPEGDPVEKRIVIPLDPLNHQNRLRQYFSNDYSDFIDSSTKSQITTVALRIPEDAIPGTETCVLSALGNQFVPTVETSLEDLYSLLEGPPGSDEQNIIYFARTLYTVRYWKSTGRITAEEEERSYDLIRKEYSHQLNFRKPDGSFGAWINTPSSIWLTAFVTRVFCQASDLVVIDPHVKCSGVTWLLRQQHLDGCFEEDNPFYDKNLMGGVTGKGPLTAYILLTLEACQCDINMVIPKARAIEYLAGNLGSMNDSLSLAITAYALALSNSESKNAANSKLLALGKYNEESNTLHWGSGTAAANIEATSYALLTQLQLSNLEKIIPIVNWLNSQRIYSGISQSTQDTVVALQALSEYAIRARFPKISLESNITISNDRKFHRIFKFDENNAHILQELKLDKIGGRLFIHTTGSGVGLLSVKLRYNVPTPPEKLCKFHIAPEVSEVKERQVLNADVVINPQSNDTFVSYPDDLIRGIERVLDEKPGIGPEIEPRNRHQRISCVYLTDPILHPKQQTQKADSLLHPKTENTRENITVMYNIKICVRYFGDHETGMSIVDAGLFSGFKPNKEHLKELLTAPETLIESYDILGKNIVFHLKKIPNIEPYCFEFRITQDYIVGNTQTSVIKVYDYYNPDESCTVFYRSDNDSPLLHKICDEGICQCAEGGCPPKNPLLGMTRENILDSACDEHDYVWKGKVMDRLEKGDGFLRIKFFVQEALKEGIETAQLLEGETRELLIRDNCDSAELQNQEYLLMGNDGVKYENKNGEIRYRYILDKSSKVQKWVTISGRKYIQLARELVWLRRALKRKSCEL